MKKALVAAVVVVILAMAGGLMYLLLDNRNLEQEKLEMLLSRMLDQRVELAASGRTDAGVHALGVTYGYGDEDYFFLKAMDSSYQRYVRNPPAPMILH